MASVAMTPSVERSKRPPKLDLRAVGDVDAVSSLRTPKEIAADIALQCVSPAIPSFVHNDVVEMAKSIEAQQRRLIAERIKNDPTTPKKSRGFRRTSWRRGPRPADIIITSHMKQQHPCIYSAPSHMMHTPLSGPEGEPPTISADIYQRKGSLDGLKSAKPGYKSKWNEFSEGLRGPAGWSGRSSGSSGASSANREPSSSAKNQLDRQDSSDEDDDGRDPEEAALSDNEKEDNDSSNKGRRYGSSEVEFEQQSREELRRRRRMRFMSLCGEIWDLLHEETDL